MIARQGEVYRRLTGQRRLAGARPGATPWLVLALVTAAMVLTPAGGAPQPTPRPAAGLDRAVIDNERGLIFGEPHDGDWTTVGAYMGLPVYDSTFQAMAPGAIKIAQGRFHHFSPVDEQQFAYFPTGRLRSFEARETAAGRPPLFVTATYEGQQRPVYFLWSLKIDDRTGRPTAPPSEWMQAVNVADERFIRFWIDEYARNVLMRAGLPNTWVGLDNCAFQYPLYGVLDRTSRFRADVRWDRPFAQDEAQLLTSVKRFFRRVRELAADLRLICNVGDLTDPAGFPDLYADVAGVVEEDLLYHYKPDDWSRQQLYYRHLNAIWLSSVGKVGVMSFHTLARDGTLGPRLRTSFVHYLILRGANFFFAPQFDVPEVPPALYEDMAAGLGLPTGPATSEAVAGRGDGYRVYSRPTEGGLVFLNWSGAPRRIELPPGRLHYDRNGRAVSQLILPDMTGDYVVSAPGPRVAPPTISPRGSPPARGPVLVRLASATRGARIHYTLDGSEPTATSPEYRGPLTLTRSGQVRARAVLPGRLDSFVRAASFVLSD